MPDPGVKSSFLVLQDDIGGGGEPEDEENQKFSKPPPTNDLRKMLCQTEEPVIGLHYVEELMPETNRDSYPPHYACGLCNVAAAPASRDRELNI